VIDPRAVVSPQAQLAPDVSVGAFSLIGADVAIGARTRIEPHVVISGPTTIGADNHIFPFAAIGSAPQDKKYRDEPTRLEIGDRNVFRESCTINRGTTHDQGVTRIGSDNLFMAYAHVAHDCQIGNQTVYQFAKIGAHAFLGGGTILSRDVPPYVMVTGNPAVPHTVNSEGLKRRGFTEEQIRTIRDAYRILYRSDLKLAEAIARLEVLAQTHAEIRPFVAFIHASNRSLVR
jgi:UDP-N-acetylglucosamine acyltransferase